ncbi:MAG: DUF3006 domain-containing protein [Clostridiales bacterium]|nr:DUF3006 domain-containing protein [Clostridiales bacterium]
MEPIQYKVLQFDGDYAILITADGTKTKVARALLPPEIEEGNFLIYENAEYRII